MNEAVNLQLTCSLIEGSSDQPPWSRFLDQLREATGANYATLMFRPPGRPFMEAVSMLSGGSLALLHEGYKAHLYPRDLLVNKVLEEGRLYSLDALMRSGEGSEFQAHREYVARHNITALRQVRVREPSGVDAWLTIARHGSDFDAAAERVVEAIIPVLKATLKQHVIAERARLEFIYTAEAVRRMQFGWFTLDADATILDSDLNGANILAKSGILSRSPTGRLIARPQKLMNEIKKALMSMAASTHSRGRAISLEREPWLDMLLLPAEKRSISARGTPVAIAYVHGDSWRTMECSDQLAELFRLSPREAEIALALCRGMSIPEVAIQVGVTIGTARNHTKSIYAKTGARGLPDLVRIVMRSILTMAGTGGHLAS